MNSKKRLNAGIILAVICLLLFSCFLLNGCGSGGNPVKDESSLQTQTSSTSEKVTSAITVTEPAETLPVMYEDEEEIVLTVHEDEFTDEQDISLDSDVSKPTEAEPDPAPDIVTGPWIDIDF